MTKYLILLISLLELGWGQSSFDILNTPTDSKAAALGLTLNPVIKPTLLLTRPRQAVTLNVWNWVAGIQGATMGLELHDSYLNVQAMHSGELEYRNDTPSVEPLSTFEYTLFDLGVAHAFQWQQLSLGIGAELVYERTLNASATGLSFNLASAYRLNKRLLLGAGLRHFGFTGKLDEAATTLPSEAWADLQLQFTKLALYSELNSGSLPLASGFSYAL